MSNISAQLESLRQRIAQSNAPDGTADYLQDVSIIEVGELFHVDFYGSPFSEGYGDLIDTLAQLEVASQIKSLKFRTPDEGANGTCNWDLEPMLSTDAVFTRLVNTAKPIWRIFANTVPLMHTTKNFFTQGLSAMSDCLSGAILSVQMMK